MAANAERRKVYGMGGLRIGRLAGIDILVHWSWLVIFSLLTWSLAESLFLHDYPSWTRAEAWVAAAITSLVVFASVLVHELSHSIMARRQGMDVSSITLFIFGGVSALTEEPRSPRQELTIAAVGPATSLLLAGLFGVGGLLFKGAAGTALLYLAFINAVLAAFNLLPGFPLDGGRLLRALAWARRGDLLEATRIASLSGTVLAYALMAGGLLVFLFGGLVSGLWFIVIGLFLRLQAEGSFRQVIMRDVLQGIPVAAAVRRDVHPVPPQLSLSSLSDYVLAYNDRRYPVLSGDRLLGLVCLGDLQKYPRDEWQARSVSEVMTPWERLQVVQTSDDLAKAAELMTSLDLEQLPAMEEGHFAGFVTRSDITRLIQIRRQMSRSGSNARTQKPVGVER
jgi:Zn-dependent protease